MLQQGPDPLNRRGGLVGRTARQTRHLPADPRDSAGFPAAASSSAFASFCRANSSGLPIHASRSRFGIELCSDRSKAHKPRQMGSTMLTSNTSISNRALTARSGGESGTRPSTSLP